jgi:hypothetical protein
VGIGPARPAVPGIAGHVGRMSGSLRTVPAPELCATGRPHRRTVLAVAAGTTATAVSPADAAEECGDQSPASAARTLRAAADHAVERLHAVAPGVTGFAVGTKFEKWTYSHNADWAGGFWPGTLWMAYLHSGEDVFRPRPRLPVLTVLGHRLAADRRRQLARGRDRGGRVAHRDDKYLHNAVEHAKTAQWVFPRPDGSTPHVFGFDPDTSAPIGPNTVQG